jgi:hypothetical protein
MSRLLRAAACAAALASWSTAAAATSQPAVALAPTALAFGDVVVGSSKNLVAQVQNLGAAPLGVTGVSPCLGTTGEFSFSPAAAFAVAPGASQPLSVTYRPVDTTQDGGCVELSTTDPSRPIARLALSGAGTASAAGRPAIALSPDRLAFGVVVAFTTSTQVAQVRNTGTASLSVYQLASCAGTSAEFSYGPRVSFDVAPGAAQALTVSYSPVDPSSDTGCIQLTTNDPVTPVARVALSGAGTLAPPTQTAARQNLGIYDHTYDRFGIVDCFGCHTTQTPACTDPLAPCAQASTQHHNLLDPENPHAHPELTCGSCHPSVPDPSTGEYVMTVSLDCTACHPSSPHHTTAQAQAARCTACHGSTVVDLGDPKVIPTSPPSSTTPATGCRVWADATGSACEAGGCAACHAPSLTATPEIADNATLHHGTGLGVAPNPASQCGWCHVFEVVGGIPSAALDIRTCEQCHPYASLHNIQYDAAETMGTPGWGHVGADPDCWGCHGWFAKYELPPGAGATVPTIEAVAPTTLRTGAAARVSVSGHGFTNTVTAADGTTRTYTPVVVLGQHDDAGALLGPAVALAPASFTDRAVVVDVPATLRSGAWQLRVVKGYGTAQETRSNRRDAFVLPTVAITSATLACPSGSPQLTLDGRGFGPRPPAEAPTVGVFVGSQRCAITTWSDTTILAGCATAVAGSTAAVVGAFNVDVPVTAPVIGAGCGATNPAGHPRPGRR